MVLTGFRIIDVNMLPSDFGSFDVSLFHYGPNYVSGRKVLVHLGLWDSCWIHMRLRIAPVAITNLPLRVVSAGFQSIWMVVPSQDPASGLLESSQP